ncbi:MAG: DNA repair protein RadC [Deltaproteobacteria bacterium]|nr:MAG: DNA repair protein RadC [Deltaproteobacteria bacterium]
MARPSGDRLSDHISDLPRERLRALGSAALSDRELLALVLRTGVRGDSALDLSARLLEHCGGLRGLARVPARQLLAQPGVGLAKSASVLAALEIGRRLASRRLREGDPLTSPADVHRHFHAHLRDVPQERFLVVLLDGRHRVLREVTVSQGTLTASLVHPREVFRPALGEAAAAVVLVHNHPSGDPTPSREDIEVTARLARAGDILGIPVLDHVVVAERGYASLREAGHLPTRAPAGTALGGPYDPPKARRVRSR